MIGRDVHVVRPGVHHVERGLGLGQEMVPLIDGKVGVGTHKNR